MGANAANAYGLGVALGLASFFTSRGDHGSMLQSAEQSVNNAKDFVNALSGQSISLDVALLAGISRNQLGLYGHQLAEKMNKQIVSARGSYAPVLAGHRAAVEKGNTLGMVYNLGVSIGIAEGQLSVSGDQAARNIAFSALTEAQGLATHLKGEFGFLKPENFNNAEHKAVENLRESLHTHFNSAGTTSSSLVSDHQPGWRWISCSDGVLKGSPSVVRRQPGLMELFGRGTDDRTWQNTFVNGKWTGWFPHNDGFALGSTPTVGSMNSAHLMLVACTAGGVAHSKTWLDSAGKWTNWEPLGAATLKDSPSIICRNSKLVEIFGRGMDDRTWQNSFTNGKWTGWFPHNDGFTLGSTPSVGSMNSAHLMLVACAAGGAVKSKTWLDSAGKWTSWEPLGAATLKGSPSIISRNQQLVELFGRGLDDRTWQNTFVNGKWLGWFSHKDDFAIATTPTVGSLTPDHLQLFVTDPNGRAKQKWWFD